MKKAKSIYRTKNQKKTKWKEVLTTAFAIVCFGATVFFIVYRIYSQETVAPIGGHKIDMPQAGTMIDHRMVCMASNVYMGEGQTAVIISGNQYFSCGTHCTRQLQLSDSIRMVKDPLTKTLFDKSEAFITMNPDSARTIMYFQTEENMRKYVEQNRIPN